MHPDKLATSTSAKFGFTVRGGKPRFQCRLDGRAWSACQSPVTFSKLAVGSHSFSVRALGRAAEGTARPPAFAGACWNRRTSRSRRSSPASAPLYPGAPAQALPLVIANPNPVPILVTSLQVRATADPPGCASAENLILTRIERLQRGPDQGAGERLDQPAGTRRLGPVDPVA